MGRADEYRRYGLACLDSAKHSTDENAKQDLMKLAEMWARLASLAEADQTPGLDPSAAAEDLAPPEASSGAPADER